MCCGGAPVPTDVRREFEERYDFAFQHTYGSTEAPGAITADPVDRPAKYDSVGAPLPHVRITIEDEDGNQLPAGEVGEICAGAHESGPYAGVFESLHSYWAMPEATERALRHGRYHMGDVGYLDEDGYLHLVDRKNDLLIRGGMNVYPRELERLLSADPRISESAVIGVPDERYGEVPYAYVRLAAGARLTREEAMALVNEQVAGYKSLEGLEFVDDFPRNSLGKVVKRELRRTGQPA
jgi:long-chain acyl-CoA synthetase